MESMSVSPGPLQEGPALDEYDNFDAISRMVKRNESKDNKLEMLVQLNINERLKTLTQNVTPEGDDLWKVKTSEYHTKTDADAGKVALRVDELPKRADKLCPTAHQGPHQITEIEELVEVIKYELVAYDVAVKGKRNRPFVKEDHEPANLTEEFRTSDHPVQEPKTTKQQEVIKNIDVADVFAYETITDAMAMKLFAEVGKLPVETEHSGMMELEVEKPEMTTEEQTKQEAGHDQVKAVDNAITVCVKIDEKSLSDEIARRTKDYFARDAELREEKVIKYELVEYDVNVKGKRNRPFVKEDHEPANLTEEFRTSDHPVQEPKTKKQQEVVKNIDVAEVFTYETITDARVMKLFAEVGKLPVETEHSGMTERQVKKPEMTTEEQTEQEASHNQVKTVDNAITVLVKTDEKSLSDEIARRTKDHFARDAELLEEKELKETVKECDESNMEKQGQSMGWCVDQEPNNSLERRTDSIEYCSDSFPTIATVSRNMTSSLMRSEAFVLRCQEKEAEVENFRRKIEKPCKENNSLHQKADALVHQVDDQQLKAAFEKISALNEKVNSVEGVLVEKDGKLATKKVEIEILKTELQEKTRQVQEQETDVISFKCYIDILHKLKSRGPKKVAYEEIDNLNEKVNHLKEELAEKNVKLTTKEMEVLRLRTELQEKARQAEKQKATNEEIIILNEKLNCLKEELAERDRKLATKEMEVQRLKTELAENTRHADELV